MRHTIACMPANRRSIAEAAADRLRHEALRDALDQWQDDGPFTAEELGAAEKALCLPTHTSAKKERTRESAQRMMKAHDETLKTLPK